LQRLPKGNSDNRLFSTATIPVEHGAEQRLKLEFHARENLNVILTYLKKKKKKLSFEKLYSILGRSREEGKVYIFIFMEGRKADG
jgi:hypothetical protein